MNLRLLKVAILLSCAGLSLWSGRVAADELPPVLLETQNRCQRFLDATRDMTVVQEMTMAQAGDTVVSIQTIYRRGADTRTDMRLEGPGGILAGLPTTVISLAGATTLLTPMGAEQLSPAEAAEYEPEHICWDFTNLGATVVGSTTVDGYDCEVVELEEEGQKFRLNVDKQRFLVLGGEVVSDEPERLYWRFSDFRPAAYDFELPRLIEMFAGDQRVSILRVTAVDVNTGLGDEVFDPAKISMPTQEELLQQMLGGEEQK